MPTITETAESMEYQLNVSVPGLILRRVAWPVWLARLRHDTASGAFTGMQAYAIAAAFRELTRADACRHCGAPVRREQRELATILPFDGSPWYCRGDYTPDARHET